MLKDAEALNRGKYYCTEQQTFDSSKQRIEIEDWLQIIWA